MQPVCWLFCQVIDNWGDVGVSWRLARELRTRLGAQVYLFLDEMTVLPILAPDFADENNIFIKQWLEDENTDLADVPPPDLAIEMFACRLPENVIQIIKQNQAVWLNWEYLSAEAWAVRTHGMLSLQADGFAKYFWQMGFVAESGGLLRETDFRQPENHARRVFSPNKPLKIMIFAYESEVWADWLRAWAQFNYPMEIDVYSAQVWRCLPTVSGSLNIRIRQQASVPQKDFDNLLAKYDCLMVRGEDSCVRAQLAGKPFFWHIYQQADLAHLAKLAAFWEVAGFNENVIWKQAHQALSGELNGAFRLPENERVANWQILFENLITWQETAWAWQADLHAQSDAVSRLAMWLKSQHLAGARRFQAA